MSIPRCSLGRRRRRTSARAHALLAGTFLTAVLSLACGAVEVLHGLPEADANRVLATLHSHGIRAQRSLVDAETNTWSVLVPGAGAERAWSLLAEYKLPQPPSRRFKDVFGQRKLVTTPLEERALFIEALQGEISHTLEAVDGVIDARVHLVLPERDLSGQPFGPAKASVVVEYLETRLGGRPLQDAEVRAIVAHAVNDLQEAAVSVVQKPASIATVSSTPRDLQWVSVGPLVVERSSLVYLKASIAATTLLLAACGLLVAWQGQRLQQLRAIEQAEAQPLLPAKSGQGTG